LDELKSNQNLDLTKIENHKRKLIKAIFDMEEFFDFDFTKEELKEWTLHELVEMFSDMIDEIEERFGLKKNKK
jgi:hypothetical protein